MPTGYPIANDLDTNDAQQALSAAMGKRLKELIKLNGGEWPSNYKVPVRILFVGNSLNQDAVSYLPLVLNEYKDYIDYKLYLWYNGGYRLDQQIADFNNNVKAEIFSVCENAVGWTNYTRASNGKTMADVLSGYTFDIVTVQEFFSNMRTTGGYTSTYKQAFVDVINYIKTNYSGSNGLDFYSYWESPLRKTKAIADENFKNAADGIEWQLQNGSIGIVPAGIATYRAIYRNGMESLGERDNITAPDSPTDLYCHSQEGLACLMQAWAIGQWIFRLFGLPFDCRSSNVRMTQAIHTALNVPGQNGSLIVGTEWQAKVAQGLAASAFEEGQYHVGKAACNAE